MTDDRLSEPLDPVVLAERLGDTFIDWRITSPVNQWKRIVEMLDSLNVTVVTTKTWDIEID